MRPLSTRFRPMKIQISYMVYNIHMCNMIITFIAAKPHLLDIDLRGDSGRVELTTTAGHARGKGLKLAICVHGTSLDNQTADQENIAKVVCRQLGKQSTEFPKQS